MVFFEDGLEVIIIVGPAKRWESGVLGEEAVVGRVLGGR